MSSAEEFERDLATLINRYSIDAAVSIPDYILARHLCLQVTVLSQAVESVKKHEQ